MTNRIKELIEMLNKASSDYYNSNPSMTDREWDKLYGELKALENETNIIYPDSPTQNVGYRIVGEIEEVEHNHPMLSLDKCHTMQELIEFAGDKDCILSVKCDGLTTSLHYVDGKLVGAETRGNGVFGGNVLHNVMTIKNVPHTIPYKEELIIDGETIIDWDMFNLINDNLPEGQKKYKHPRNLVSGSLNVLDSKVAASRNMRFIGWRVIKGLNEKSVFFALKDAEKLGFEIVPMWTYTNKSTDKENISAMLSDLQDKADKLGIPYDGAVMSYDDVEYGVSLGRTDKFFRHSIAYKYEDELYETTLRDIEWNTSKTGLINPIAVFDETVIEGASITKATLHNISYIEDLQLGIGDEIVVYRANMVIPKVHDNLTRSNTWTFPDECPVCGGITKIVKENDSKVLMCDNPNCKGKLLGKLTHAVSKNALNIDGMSEATIEFLIERGWLTSIKDIYRLDWYREPWKEYDGFGNKSVDKLLDNVEASRKTNLMRVLYAQSIPLIGKSASKDIANHCQNDIETFCGLMNEGYDFSVIDGFGTEMQKSLVNWWSYNRDVFMDLLKEFEFESTYEVVTDKKLEGLTFVITGSLINFGNRTELQNLIESKGGKVSGSVSAKTSYLINNDVASTSGKNKKAKDLGIPIISEEDFLKMIG